MRTSRTFTYAGWWAVALALGVVVFSAGCGAIRERVAQTPVLSNTIGTRSVVRSGEFLGIVRQGAFHLLAPRGAMAPRFTSIQMQEARAPESGELDLSGYEGRAIVISGHDGGGWVYSAGVTEAAGPVLTAVVVSAFGEK